MTISINAVKRRKSTSLKVSSRRFAKGQHGRDDVRVVDLTTAEGIAATELDELIPHTRAVLEDREALRERGNVCGCLGETESFSQSCSRVITAMYSRRICRLIESGSPTESRAREARARSRNGALRAVA